MAITQNFKKQVDAPVWEQMNQSPTLSTAISAMTSDEEGTDPFLYYLVSSTFYRYDTRSDSWQTLATPSVAPATGLDLRYTKRRGYHGRILSATSTSVTIPGLRGPVLNGKTIKIEFGTGQGQERVLTYTGETIHDFGVLTATTVNSITDNLKKWRCNQWAGYMMGITYGTDATQYKKILYNDATTLYVSDVNLQPHDPWNNAPFVAASPYALPVVTAGSQAHFIITSSAYSVPAWTTIPTSESFFTTLTGGIYVLSAAAAAPFATLQYFDVIHGSWQTKTVPQSMILAAYATDICLERTGKVGVKYTNNIGAISSTNRTLTDAGQTMVVGRYMNYRLVITGGTGVGQSRRIVCNTATTFTTPRNWDVNPAADTTYEVWPDFDRVYIGGGAASAMYAYSPENDYWMQGNAFDDGVVSNISAKYGSWMNFGVSTGARAGTSVVSVDSTPTDGGTLYVEGDVLTCSVGGTGAQVRVTSIAQGGVVTGIELIHSGTGGGYVTGTGKATTGGTGLGCTISITAGVAALITLNSAHFLKTGDIVTFAGCDEAAWNAAHTIIGVPGTTTFCVATSATLSMAATETQSTTVIVDPTKNWIVNEHAGRIVDLCVAGTGPTSQKRWIISNTATTLTVATIVAGVNGLSKYVIYDSKLFGADDQYKSDVKVSYGHATGGSDTTMQDTSKTWKPDQWINYYVRYEAGTGYGSGKILITGNTENTLIYASQAFTPDASSHYEIADSWGLASSGSTTTIVEATNKNWQVNQWAGKRVKVSTGSGVGNEITIVSNTATTLTFAAVTGLVIDTTSAYCILDIPVRGAGTKLIWLHSTTNESIRGKYIFSPRGSLSNTADIYDITTQKWIHGYFFSPQAELLTTGSSATYDGEDTIFFIISAPNPRVFSYNINTNEVVGGGQIPVPDSTARVGNRLEVVVTEDGFKYLYWMKNAGTELLRSLLWYID